MKKLFGYHLVMLSVCLFVQLSTASAQILDPVYVTPSYKDLGNGSYDLVFSTKIDEGWHVYSQFIGEGGPIPSSINFDEVKGFQKIGKPAEIGTKEKAYEELFEMDLTWFEKSVSFKQKIKVTEPTATVKGYFEYMTCNDRSCLPPTQVEFSFKLKGAPSEPLQKDTASKSEIKPVDTLKKDTSAVVGSSQSNAADSLLSKKDISSEGGSTASFNNQQNSQFGKKSWWSIFLVGFAAGLFSLITPCVYSMIPLTVTFFTKKSGSRKKGISTAMLYGLSIILIFVMLGFILYVFGISGDSVNEFASNGIFNFVLFLLFVVFAISFFGVFEITLPSSLINKSESMSDKGGLIGIFFMAFTLVLVSFSCTVPFIGGALAFITQGGSATGPILGMFAYSLALALPFGLFAFFPSWLQSLPKSGGWLNVVKVVFAFVELALALKFLSNVDLAYHWGLLDREVFLVLWIVIFAMLGFYLLGNLKFVHDSDVTHVSIPRLFLAIISFAFALYMIPGLWGAPLKAISAFAPPQSTQDFDLFKVQLRNYSSASGESQKAITSAPKKYDEVFHCPHDIDCYFDYEEGLAVARQQKKPVILDFTGWSCVNCRKMEVSVWSDPEVLRRLKEDYVLISLYVDDKTVLPDSSQYISKFSGKKIKTIGNKYSDVQASQYGTNSQPYYVLLDPRKPEDASDRLLGHPRAFNEDIDAYVNFLDKGLIEYSGRAVN